MTLISTITQRDGLGRPTTFTFPDGKYYKGGIKDNYPDGYGSLYNKDGTIIEEKVGLWRKGEFICTENELQRYPNKYRFLIEE